MNIKEQFNLIAREYDENRRKFIPCFNDYYVSATDFVAKSLEKEHEQKKNLFKMIYDSLSEGGNFVNYDQFCTESELADKKTNPIVQSRLNPQGFPKKSTTGGLSAKNLTGNVLWHRKVHSFIPKSSKSRCIVFF